MFKRRAIQVKVVKTPKNDKDFNPTMVDVIGESSARLVNELAKDFLKYATATVVGAIVIVKAADTLSQIAVKKTKNADNEK